MRRQVLVGSLLVAAMGCALPNNEDDYGTSSDAISAEISGKVDYAYRQYGNANIARAQFATPNFNGCSSTMIGPNIMLTAAHCGPAEAEASQVRSIRFITYRSSETQQNTETFDCRRLIHGWPRHDLAIHYCDPNAAGVNPGDKYGYLDFETRAPAVGDQVYSIWWNSIDTGATGSQSVPLYSAGQVTSTNFTFWGGTITSGPFQNTGPAGHPVGIEMSTYGFPGTSGSSNIDPNTNRILVGPTTLARNPEQSWKAAWSMNTYWGVDLMPRGFYPGANEVHNIENENFPSGNYDFNSYVGLVDKDGNHVFDVQQDIEAQHGENQRSTYYLGFNNRRRNALWAPGWFYLNYDAKTMLTDTGGAVAITRHPLLHLKPNTNYRIGVRVNTTSASSPTALAVDFEHAGVAYATGNLTTTAGTNAMRTVILRTDANADSALGIRTTDGFNGTWSDITVIEDGTVTSFELADQREGWTTVFGQAGNFLPHGITSETAGATPDFALAVMPLFNGAIPVSTQGQLFAHRNNRLCFSARALGATTESGVVKVTGDGGTLLSETFPLTQTWTQHCYHGIGAAVGDTTLTFSGSGLFTATMLIDNLKVDQDLTVVLPHPPISVLQ